MTCSRKQRACSAANAFSIRPKGKARITIMLDNEIIVAFRALAEAQGTGYQTAINTALRATLDKDDVPLTVRILRQVLRQELHATTATQ